MKRQDITRPCEYCGTLITKSATQQSQRKYWTCNASCANKLRIKLGNTPWPSNPLRGQQETRPCVWCGTPVTRYLTDKRLAQVWTCSKTCKASYRTKQQMDAGVWKRPIRARRGVTEPCPICGKDVYRAPIDVARGTRRFCSKACADVDHTKTPVLKTCRACGKELALKPSQAGIQYCSRACMAVGLTKRPMDRTHNGKPARKDLKGYVMVYEPDHPNKSFHGWQYEHRLVAEQSIGRYLRSDEAVHHKNGQKDDNRPENLEVMDLNEHATMSVQDYRDDLNRKLAELEDYKRRYGPLEEN